MATGNDTPTQKPNAATKELNTQFAQFDDELTKLIAIQYFQLTAIQAITAYGWPEDSNKLTFGLSLTTEWITAKSDALTDRLDKLKGLMGS